MSPSLIVRFVALTFVLSLSGSAFAAPPSRAAMIPIQEEAMKMARERPAAAGYRDAFVRFGVRSPVAMRPRAAR